MNQDAEARGGPGGGAVEYAGMDSLPGRRTLTADEVQKRLRYIVEKDHLVLDDLPRRFLEVFAAVLKHTNYRQVIDNYARDDARAARTARPSARSTSRRATPGTCPATGRTSCSRPTAGTSHRVASSRRARWAAST